MKMKKFIVKHTDKEGDLSTVWVMSTCKSEAVSEAKSEYWDIDEIVSVCEEK